MPPLRLALGVVVVLVAMMCGVCSAANTPKVFQLSDSRSAVPVVEWGESLVVRIEGWDATRDRLLRVLAGERVVWEAGDPPVAGSDPADDRTAQGEIALRAYADSDVMRIAMVWYSPDDVRNRRSVVELRVACDPANNNNQCYTVPPGDLRDTTAKKGSGVVHQDRRPRGLTKQGGGGRLFGISSPSTTPMSKGLLGSGIAGLVAVVAITPMAVAVAVAVITIWRRQMPSSSAVKRSSFLPELNVQNQEASLWPTTAAGGKSYRNSQLPLSSSSSTSRGNTARIVTTPCSSV